MTPDPFTPDDHSDEPLAAGGTWLLDLVATVDHLRRGHRPGITVWDALEEAVRWTLNTGPDETEWDAPDPLARTLHCALDQPGTPIAGRLQAAVRRWVLAMADRYNSGHHWPHPTPRRGFPPPSQDIGDDRDLS